MKRRTLDVVFSAGGLALAGLLLVMGMVLGGNATFAKGYVADQLGQQKITFKAVGALTEPEKQAACLVENAGKPLTTGKQAECYANEFIGLHLKSIPSSGGLTYAELGNRQNELRAKVAAAPGTDPSQGDLQKQLANVTSARDTVFKGETLRGLLLTSYGFSVLGEKAGQGAAVAYAVSALLALLSIAGFVHAFVTPRDRSAWRPLVLGNGHHPVENGASAREPVEATAPARRTAPARAPAANGAAKRQAAPPRRRPSSR